MDDVREQLAQTESQIRSLRQEKARLGKLFEAAKASLAEHETETTLAAAHAAKEAVQTVVGEIDATRETQVSLLRQIGDMESGVAGFASPGLDGWDSVVQTLDLEQGQLHAQVGAASLLNLAGPRRRSVRSVDVATPPVSNKYLFPVLPSQPFGGRGDLVATDYTVVFAEDQTTGIEIPPATSTAKAELDATVQLATPTAQTFAIVIENVPSKIFETRPALSAFLGSEMQRRLDVSLDQHVISGIEGASPPSGSTGTGLVAQIRNAIAAHRDLGSNPRYLALTSTDAAALDLTEDTAGHYVFRVDLEGSSNPVWSLLVREAEVTEPLLIDPDRLGSLYLADASVLVDPYGENMKHNLVSARLEFDGRWHTRDVRGAFQIV